MLALFHQRQLHFFDRHDLVGDGVEVLEDFHRAFGVVAADDELLAAAENGDVQRGRNLAQVFVERAAQVGQARVIKRLRDEVVRLDWSLVFNGISGVRRPGEGTTVSLSYLPPAVPLGLDFGAVCSTVEM
jgi:hypothetical protein